MRRLDLEKRIARMAKSSGVEWTYVRSGHAHDIWRCGSIQVSIPRHREINEYTARGIMEALEAELGVKWWRR